MTHFRMIRLDKADWQRHRPADSTTLTDLNKCVEKERTAAPFLLRQPHRTYPVQQTETVKDSLVPSGTSDETPVAKLRIRKQNWRQTLCSLQRAEALAMFAIRDPERQYGMADAPAKPYKVYSTR